MRWNLGRILFWVILVTASLSAMPGRADFWDGLAAYDADNFAEARDQWQPLAAAGDAQAQATLAGLYAQGLGVPPSPSRAADWFRRAAAQGHVIGQLNLGDYYARGHGVSRDLAKAWLWLSLAARQGNRWAANRRDAIEAQLSPVELMSAQQRLAAWRAIAE